MWNTDPKNPSLTPLHVITDLNSVTFSPDGATFVLAFTFGPVVFLPFNNTALLAEVCQEAGRNLTRSEYHQLIGDSPAYPAYHAICPGLPTPPDN